jgi:hypothetical protein
MFYATMVKAEDEETQLKGRVVVIWFADKQHGMDAATAWKVGQMMQGMPTKQAAIHVYIPDKQPTCGHPSILALLVYALERLLVVRLKCHFGEYLPDNGARRALYSCTFRGIANLSHVIP